MPQNSVKMDFKNEANRECANKNEVAEKHGCFYMGEKHRRP